MHGVGEILIGGGNQPDIKRVFFRGNTSAKTLLDMYNSKDTLSATADPYQNGGCSESCEVYLTE